MNKYNIDANDDNLETLEKNIEDSLVKKVISILKTDSTTPNPNTNVKISKGLSEERISGYIVFGDPYDNFIMQFGVAITSLVFSPSGNAGASYYHDLAYITLPIAFTYGYSIFSMHPGTLPVGINEYNAEHTLTNCTLECKCYSSGEPIDTTTKQWRLMWVAIGW